MFGVGSIPWSPLGRGLLTRTSRDATIRGKTDLFSTTLDMPFLDALTTRSVNIDWTAPCHFSDSWTARIDELAKKKRVSMAQISLAWMLTKPGVTAPIIGTTSLANLEDILGEFIRFGLRSDSCTGC